MATDPDHPPEPRGPDKAIEVRDGPPPDEPPPDGGEPMGAKDGRPPMLGRRFRQAEIAGMAIGLVLALALHALFADKFFSRDSNGWSWVIVAIGGIAVGGAMTLFIYGVSTDRSDIGLESRGRADVTTEGEDQRSRRRRSRDAARTR
jgi:hypothetical protein